MASLVCAISGTTPEEPVFSKTGYIFERRVIEKLLKANGGLCPITGEALTAEDLQVVRVAGGVTKPRPVTATSIPGLLVLLQDEWDSLMVETFQLRKNHEAIRQQLAHSLYQHDAACRVVARLIKERDHLKLQLSQVQDRLIRSAGPVNFGLAENARNAAVGNENLGDVVMGGEGGGGTTGGTASSLPTEILEDWTMLAKSLLSQRKKRSLEGLAPVSVIKQFRQKASYPLHSSANPGIACCTSDPKESRQHVVTGGIDGVVAFFDFGKKKTMGRLVGHLKKINQVICHPSHHVVISASEDKTVRVWGSPDGEWDDYRTSWILRRHGKGIKSVSLHPSGDYFLSGSRDKTWAIHDLHSGRTLKTYRDLPCEFSQICFHPDGMLAGAAGINNQIYIYDLKGEDTVALPGHDSPVRALQFSENGYYLATASDTDVKLWDLRKSLNLDTLTPLPEDAQDAFISSIKFDNSSSYLAVCCGSNKDRSFGQLFIYNFETRTKLANAVSLEGHEGCVTDATFGPNAEHMVSTSLDRTVRLWAPLDGDPEAPEAPAVEETQDADMASS